MCVCDQFGKYRYNFILFLLQIIWRVWFKSQQQVASLLRFLLQHTGCLVLDHIHLKITWFLTPELLINLLLNFGDFESTLDDQSDPNQGDDGAFSAEICGWSENGKRVCQELDWSISLNKRLPSKTHASRTRCFWRQLNVAVRQDEHPVKLAQISLNRFSWLSLKGFPAKIWKKKLLSEKK